MGESRRKTLEKKDLKIVNKYLLVSIACQSQSSSWNREMVLPVPVMREGQGPKLRRFERSEAVQPVNSWNWSSGISSSRVPKWEDTVRSAIKIEQGRDNRNEKWCNSIGTEETEPRNRKQAALFWTSHLNSRWRSSMKLGKLYLKQASF